MPLHDLLEDALAATFNDVAVARDDAVKVPLVDLGDALVEAWTIGGRLRVPYEALLCEGRALGAVDVTEEAGEEAGCSSVSLASSLSVAVTDCIGSQLTCRAVFALAELLSRRKVEDQVALDQRPVGLEVEHELLAAVAAHELVVEAGVKVGIDFGGLLVLL
jgi:hypothetical protein